MGANNYRNNAKGKSMSEAYNDCVKNADDVYGHQEGYSGQINCSCGYVDKTAMWKASKLPLNDFINKYEDGDGKGDRAWGICIKEPVGNSNKVKSTVSHDVFKGTRKWELLYIPQTLGEQWYGKPFDNKADAVKAAREYTEKHGRTTIVTIERRLAIGSGSSTVARIEYKSNSKEAPGSYVFFGLAPC